MKINVFGRVIKVERHDLSKEDLNGDYCARTHVIRLDEKLKGKELQTIILHEELHALFDRIGVRDAIGSESGADIEEILCRTISEYIFETYRLKRIVRL